ncbi:MAG: universal stress protein [Magnetococcales bacterium]|nr:universal stress protein [Magnetococcales bacterium]
MTIDSKDTHDRFRILVCIDGSEESYRGLRYAAKLGQGMDSDISLLYVRMEDQGMKSEGLQVRVARENMLEWGLDLPEVGYLEKGREMLLEMGNMTPDWEMSYPQRDVRGDPSGDHMVEYSGETGKRIRLRLKVSASIETGILDQQEEGNHDLIILGASGRRRKMKQKMDRILGVAPVALKVAAHAPCSVIIARQLEVGYGHLICVDRSKRSLEMARKDAELAYRCGCPVSLLSVATSEEELKDAEEALADCNEALSEMKIPVEDSFVRVGDPVHEIIEAGKDYSLVVMSDTDKSGMRRFFIGGVSFNVLEHAETSVLIVR